MEFFVICIIDGCENEIKGHSARNMCKTHYNRFLLYGDPLAADRRKMRKINTCSVDGCHEKCHGHGLCGKHYQKYKKYGDPLYIHPMFRTEHSAERNSWSAMIERCTNKEHPHYKDYGGRGIKVCKEWSAPGGFWRFYEDMGPRPKGTSLDRIDVDGDYTPDNCRWSDDYKQQNNKRNSRYIVIGEEKKTVSEWARIYGVSIATAFSRLRKGEDGERVFRPPWSDRV